MSQSFFFYDLETSGFRPSSDRIMQFAGQRTNQQFEPLGKPYNLMAKLPSDILPQPEAILFTGLSISANSKTGISEPEFAKLFNQEIAQPDTVFIGFNNLRFDDEFIRYANYRNFYDAYSWHWSLNRSRWDLLDAVRMTRALRPDGINWPMDKDKPSNRLELLTKVNKLKHLKAHDALSDVMATIEVAKLVKSNQPKLFNYLLNLRSKAASNKLINSSAPYIYTSGRYSTQWLHTSVVLTMDFNSESSTAQVYNLRVDPGPLLKLSVKTLTERWRPKPDRSNEEMPLKTIKLNRCPAVAPLSVLDEASISRLNLDMAKIDKNKQVLLENIEPFSAKLKEVIASLNAGRDYTQKRASVSADTKLYDKFISSADQRLFPEARQARSPTKLRFSEARLNDLYLIYIARNHNSLLAPKEKALWHELTHKRLFGGGEESLFNKYNLELKEQAAQNPGSKLIKELQVLSKSIADDYGKP